MSRRRLIGLSVAFAAPTALTACATQSTTTPAPSAPPSATGNEGWRTVWEDRFDQRALNGQAWTAANYGGNRDLGELQYNHPSMVGLEGGNLVLRARREDHEGYTYLAGSVSSKGKVALGPHGRLTTRQYISSGTGIGVGVCLYGVNIDEVGWPACGEIDATEIAIARGDQPFASVHGPGYSGGSPISATGQKMNLVGRWAEHTLEWEPGRISWAIDGENYHVAQSSDPRAAGGWPFEQPFFVTIVMTVGSGLSGPVDEATWPRNETGVQEDPYAVFEFIRFEQRA